jgi:hypothetical protein
MTKELRDRWLEALRSGRYEQGKHRLHDYDKDGGDLYCSLGVLADVIDPNGWEMYRERIGKNWKGSGAGLPSDVLDRNLQKTIITLNDSTGRTFCQIADSIEHTFLAEEQLTE